MKWSLVTSRFVFGFNISFKSFRNQRVCGWTNRTEDGFYLLFLDYDNIDGDFVLGELLRLQNFYDLSSFYVFKSNNGFHAVCLDKFNFYDFYRILKDTSVDMKYITFPVKYGVKNWVLRQTEKDNKRPQYLKKLPASSNLNRSNAHRIILNRLFGLRIKKTWQFDDYTKLKIGVYNV